MSPRGAQWVYRGLADDLELEDYFALECDADNPLEEGHRLDQVCKTSAFFRMLDDEPWPRRDPFAGLADLLAVDTRVTRVPEYHHPHRVTMDWIIERLFDSP